MIWVGLVLLLSEIMKSVILRAVRHCLETFQEEPGFVLDGRRVASLMRFNRVTIAMLAKRTGVTQKRIREVRESGLDSKAAARDWVQAITGTDPGPF